MNNRGYTSIKNANLESLNTFGIKSKARELVRFSSSDAVLSYLDAINIEDFPHLILGGGSNLLFTKDFNGTILSAEMNSTEIIQEDEEYAWVKSDAGVVWHDLVQFALKHNLGGIENLSLIPGKNGAAPMQNIGAYGVELKDVLQDLTAIDLFEAKEHTFTNSECEFGYRDSIFKKRLKNRFFITSITLKLRKNPVLNLDYGAIRQTLERNSVSKPTITDVSKAVCEIRQSKLPDPKEIGNAGSFFKNPIVPKSVLRDIQKEYSGIVFYEISDEEVKIPAGWLIEKAGWKGKRFGNFGVHAKQALVLVNYGGAKGSDIFDLSENIIVDIRQKFGITLEREVNVL